MPFQPVVVFSPCRLEADPPPAGAFVTVVKYARRCEEVADAAAILRAMGREFVITWIDRGGGLLPAAALKAAETHIARGLAVSLSRGRATGVKVYREQVEQVPLSDMETVIEE
jgi:hypothetical protein